MFEKNKNITKIQWPIFKLSNLRETNEASFIKKSVSEKKTCTYNYFEALLNKDHESEWSEKASNYDFMSQNQLVPDEKR